MFTKVLGGRAKWDAEEEREGWGVLIWKSPAALWGCGLFAAVKMEEDTFRDGPSKADPMGHPQPWPAEPSLGKG